MTGERLRAIGPGRVVLVVGPSGVGKDTLINLVRVNCAGNTEVIFPVRTVTRPSSAHEDNRAVTPDAFAQEQASGAFVVAWQAHGHAYGISRQIDAELSAGRTAVLNVSRTVVASLRARYDDVVVVQIAAPANLVAARLAARARSSDGDLAVRLAREDTISDISPDIIIQNDGAADVAAAQLLDVVLNTHQRA